MKTTKQGFRVTAPKGVVPGAFLYKQSIKITQGCGQEVVFRENIKPSSRRTGERMEEQEFLSRLSLGQGENKDKPGGHFLGPRSRV